jgi:predicted O-linked N-acetylglucosamine transferase (SPINDLY family)
MEDEKSDLQKVIAEIKKMSDGLTSLSPIPGKIPQSILNHQKAYEAANYGDKVLADNLFMESLIADPFNEELRLAYGVNLLAIGHPQLAKIEFENLLGRHVMAPSNYMLACDYLGIPCNKRIDIRQYYPQPTSDAPIVKKKDKIHICYMTKDAFNHVNGRAISCVTANHDRDKFEITVMHGGSVIDTATESIAKNVDRFIHINDFPFEGAMDSRSIYDLIRRLEVDILVDCDGHTNGGARLPGVFAKRPALINVCSFGYPNEMNVGFYDLQMCHYPILSTIPFFNTCPNFQRPDRSENKILFGVISGISKISKQDIEQYDLLMSIQPEARLIYCRLKREYTIGKAEEIISQHSPINRSRISIVNLASSSYEEIFRGIDIVLDTSNWNLHGTAIDAISCGVPVLCTIGNINNKSSYLSRDVYRSINIRHITIQEIINNNIILDRQRVTTMQDQVYQAMKGFDNSKQWAMRFEEYLSRAYRDRMMEYVS